MLHLGRFQNRIVATREIPARPADLVDFPADLHPALRDALHQRGITQLYSHQAESFQAARSGQHVVVTTGTASGKSLSVDQPKHHRPARHPRAGSPGSSE